MVKDKNLKKIHLIGIGGIGISSLARYYLDQGYFVSGTNDNPSPETLSELIDQGVEINFDFDTTKIKSDTDLIVYSNAWPKNYPGFMAKVEQLGITTKSYPQALGEITKKYTTIAIAGTHGKTTTTAMVLKILTDAGMSPTGIVGSLLSETGSNYVKGESNLLVIEADEYAKAFLEHSPSIVVVTNIDHDHHDIYPELKDLQQTFRQLGEKLPEVGKLVCSALDQNSWETFEDLTREVIDYSAIDISDLNLKIPGNFNLQNAQASIAAASLVRVSMNKAKRSLSEFQGTWRRQEYKGETNKGVKVYDDYAHHPTELKAVLNGFREKFPDKYITAIFQPHLFSRTKELFNNFCGSFSEDVINQVIIVPVYSAREVKGDGPDHGDLVECINHTNVKSVDSLASALNEISSESDIIITLGAGDITSLADKLTS